MSCDVTIVTHSRRPAGAPDDVVLAGAFAACRVATRFAPWDDGKIDWAQSDITLVRSTWDYHLTPAAWTQWLEQVSRVTRLVNPFPLLRWNTDKRYLLALASAGVPIVPTAVLGADDRSGLATILAAQGRGDVILKPAVGASSQGIRRFGRDDLNAAYAHAKVLGRAGAVLVQPFQEAVFTTRERSLVMIDGRFSHAFSKEAFSRGAVDGATAAAPHAPDAGELDLAAAALAALPERPSYARVDIVPSTSGPLLMELELIEPHLALVEYPSAAGALAAAILEPATA